MSDHKHEIIVPESVQALRSMAGMEYQTITCRYCGETDEWYYNEAQCEARVCVRCLPLHVSWLYEQAGIPEPESCEDCGCYLGDGLSHGYPCVQEED